MGVRFFIVFFFFFGTVVTLGLGLRVGLCSCPLESVCCLKGCPGVHSALGKCCCGVPSAKHNFCGMCWMASTWLQHPHTCQQMQC